MPRFILSFRDRPKGGAVTNGRLILGTADGLRQQERVTFVTHGYNVPEARGISSLRELAIRLVGVQQNAIVSVLWPGDNWMGGLAYPVKGRTADDTAQGLARFLKDERLTGKELNFISHSLGARVVLETIKALPGVSINQVCLMAAAVDDTCLAAPAQYASELVRIRRVFVLASKCDKVLQLPYPLGDLTHFFQDWQNKPGLALGWHGPRPKEIDRVHHVQLDDHVPNPKADHGHYLPDLEASPEVLRKQVAAAFFANDVVSGVGQPQYRY